MLELKDNVILALEDIVVEANYNPLLEVFKDSLNILDNGVRSALKKLENYLKENGALKQLLKKYVVAEMVVSKLKPQLEENKNEIKKLKTKVRDQTKEAKRLDDQLNKSSQDL